MKRNPSEIHNYIIFAFAEDKKDNKLLITFDGWTDRYDYWAEPDSTDIHPVGWRSAQNQTLTYPYGN